MTHSEGTGGSGGASGGGGGGGGGDVDDPVIGAVGLDGRHYTARCHVAWDGVEYVGRVWFADDADPPVYYPDRGVFPGRTRDEALVLAARLTPQELERRLGRAQAEKRRFLPLRTATDDILAKVRYMNQVALSMRAGLLDAEGATAEIDLTEQQLHELIRTLRQHAGVKS